MKANCFFTYNIDTLCFRAIDNEKRKNIYFYLCGFVFCLFFFFSRRYCDRAVSYTHLTLPTT